MNDKTYKSISEVAKILNLFDSKKNKLSTHTLRFWETQFKQIKPKILYGKRRYYDEKSIKILKQIKFLLKERGMTINGVKKMLNNKETIKLDVRTNKSITEKIKNISKIIKEIKKIK